MNNDKYLKKSFNHLISEFNFKTACNFALELYDSNCKSIYLTEEQKTKIVLHLLEYSYIKNPDIKNMLAYQYVNFSLPDGLKNIIDMENTVKNIISVGVLNNIALANYRYGRICKALDLQEIAIGYYESDINDYSGQKDIVYYNKLLYQLANNQKPELKKLKRILSVLKSNNIYDLESAISVAILFDDYKFVESNIETYKKHFALNNNINIIINNYLDFGKIPKFEDVRSFLLPIAIFDNMIYNDTNITIRQ